ncbi:MAG: DNA-binding protein [Candidatus Brockarchaeota archaeon]|nr:DNA-binding protein [Candidatus Brockarchaeota archaeon]MBO3808543.1 DNA-binding protein [Candidatus Brockarchaeota archaeon]
MSEDEEIARILEQRRRQMEKDLEESKRKQEEQTVIKTLSRIVFTPEARSRLNNLRLVKPQLAEQVEKYLIALAQQGKLKIPVEDEYLKEILERIYLSSKRGMR